ncbi:hypothetical protein LX36DRAFT_704240 [Colletotrichum falcatum]|nr:hypothetical protein LX36DRAFT_704240 [Colletotrichum falcatum]
MAKLSDLPPELLLTVVSFLWTNQPARKSLFDASIRRKALPGSPLAKDLQRARSPVINLSSACKALHEALKAEKYRFVSIHGHNSAQKLLSLLRLIRLRPEIGRHIKQLHLRLEPLAHGITSVSYAQLRSLKAWAETTGVVVDDDVLMTADALESSECTAGCKTNNHDALPNEFEHDRTCLRILCAMLFHYLGDVREISLSVSGAAFVFLPDELVYRRQNSTDLLPSLRSLALEATPAGMASYEKMYVADVVAMSGIVKGLSEVYLRGFDLRWGLAEMPPFNDFLRSLVLQDVYLHSSAAVESMCRFLQSCGSLSKFIYLVTDNAYQAWVGALIPCLEITRGLMSSRKSLQTLCIDLGPRYRYYEIDESIDTLEDFSCLESLWIDSRSCARSAEDTVDDDYHGFYTVVVPDLVEGDPAPRSQTGPMRNLPPSLRRLHIGGPVYRAYDGLVWLAARCRRGAMPRLEELAFDDPDLFQPDTANLRSAFRGTGVRLCKVDRDIVTW